ncbi:MAG: FAD-linked oxidase C-terminal domain-containing protein [Gemmatimonadales bacterium]|nr:FAD-linked oxidase C-terminal domain-containing protein [Gemmatimonadales bacterium]
MTGTATALDPTLQAELERLLGDRVTVAPAIREHHGQGEAYPGSYPPDAVVFPKTTEEVSRIAALCSRHRTPMVAWGAGTSLEGHVAAVRGGVTIDLSGMDRVIRISPEDLDVTVEAGVTRKQLNEALKSTGLTFFIDPGADATIGGMTATRASGTTAVRYGTMRENVLGLTVVLADGRVIKTGGRARKSSAGYDLTRLFVGSEGTLGIITEVTLRLHGVPAAVAAAVCPFATLEGAVATVIETIQLGVPVARIELLDELFMDAVAKQAGLPYRAVPTLFFEFHGGSERGVAEDAELVKELALQHGGADFEWATDEGARARLWKARHEAYFAGLSLRPGARAMITDVCVPISRLAESILETKRDANQSKVTAAILGHVGDGNYHVAYLVDPNAPAELAEGKRLNDRMVERAIAMGGTCTGEHGIGLGKQDSLLKEHGEAVAVMRSIKQVLDPDGLMNPGKIFRT